MGKGGTQVPPPRKCCSVLCISSYSQTLSRPTIYALFSQFFWRVRAVHWVVSAVFWGRRLKKVVKFFEEKSAPGRENSGYDYEFAPLKKSCVRPCLGLVQKRTSREWFLGLGLGLGHSRVLARCASGLDPPCLTFDHLTVSVDGSHGTLLPYGIFYTNVNLAYATYLTLRYKSVAFRETGKPKVETTQLCMARWPIGRTVAVSNSSRTVTTICLQKLKRRRDRRKRSIIPWARTVKLT